MMATRARLQSRGVMIPALDPNPESDFQPFDDSGSESSEKWDRRQSCRS